MKKRILSVFLALVLCMGLAVPAFATVTVIPFKYDGSSNSVSSTTATYKVAFLETNSSGAFVHAGATDVGPMSVTIAPEETGVMLSGLYYEPDSPSNEVVVIYAYSDPDGDGIYEQRVFSNTASEYEVVPLTEKGPYTSTSNMTYAHSVPAILIGFDEENNYLFFNDDGTYTYDMIFPADKLRELFGPNTLVKFNVVNVSNFTANGSMAVLIPAEEGNDPVVSFTDVPAGAFYENAVNWAVGKDITNGTGNGKFSPGQDCTHEQILTFLYRAARGGGAASADDMAAAVSWAREKGMIGASFNPKALCTRADAVNYIWQAFNKEDAPAGSFGDVPAGADYAAAVNWAVAKGITDGTGDGNFSPNKVCNRGTIVTFLHRAYVPEARLTSK